MKTIRVDIEKIKLLRKTANISLEKMSELLGYDSLNGYYYLETGRIKFPAEKLAVVARVLNVPIEELFFDEQIAKMANK
ncbi:helix-turn-helix domain-containing protein [Neobacillus sp. M.A.Huq-85]